LHSLFLKKSADFWEQFLSDAGLCCAKIRPFEEWKNHPQVLQSKEIIPFTSRSGNNLRIPGKLMECPDWDCVALEEGESLSLETLCQLWTEQASTYSSQTGSELPLQGIRVLDLSRIIAGPFTGRLLAEYGADVMHLTIRDKHLSWEEPFHIAFNSGKKSVVVNCSHPGGRQELIEVIKKFKPDILVHNYLEEATEKLGIDYKSMKEINPDIIYLGIGGYNSNGPWAKRPGFEQCIQAASGILNTYSTGATPQILPVPFVDMSTGLITSFTAALCCFQRNKGTGGNCVSTGLTIPALYLQINSLSNTVLKNTATMLSGYYHSKDTLFYLSLKAGQESLLTKIPELQTTTPDKLVPRKLEQIFRKKSCSFWQKRLKELSLVEFIQIVPRVSAGKLLKAELKKEHGLFSYKEHEGLGNILVGRSPVTMNPQGIRELSPAQLSGKSTAEFQSTGSEIVNKRDTPVANQKRTKIQNLVSSLSQYKWILVMLWREKKLRK
jgi:crotonobetainyl-CoA:carnitine CoA-transferase CaiB-like acyl-CoA transferase